MLALLVEDYERKHTPVDPPDPVDFLLHVMESRGLSRKDMEPYIGSRGRVAEILNRVQPLTLEMIRRLSKGLGIPAEILVRDYALSKAEPLRLSRRLQPLRGWSYENIDKIFTGNKGASRSPGA